MQKYKQIFLYLFFLLPITNPVKGAYEATEEDKTIAIHTLPEVCDYTIYTNAQVTQPLLKVENVVGLQNTLRVETFILEINLENRKREMLLAAVLQSEQDQKGCKYVFSSAKLLQGKRVTQKAYQYGYHLIKTNSRHVAVALMEWLGWSYEQWYHHKSGYQTYTVNNIYTEQSVCERCYFFCLHMFKVKLSCHKKGCLGQVFPKNINVLPFFC